MEAPGTFQEPPPEVDPAIKAAAAAAEMQLQGTLPQEMQQQQVAVIPQQQQLMAMPAPMGMHQQQLGILSAEADKDALVERVKQIQRMSEQDKENWYQFCKLMNTGYRDPSRFDFPSLNRFIQGHERGEMFQTLDASALEDVASKVVRLRGVPYEATLSGVLQWLSGYNLEDEQVKFGLQSDGRKSGDVYVQFPDTATANHCLTTRQNQLLGSRYIEVFRSSEDDFKKAGGGNARPSGGGGGSQMIMRFNGNKDELVDRIKNIQRVTHLEKQKWYNFCDMNSPGCYDPGKQTVEFLTAFIQGYEAGELPSQPAMTNYLQLRGVPFTSTAFDVCSFLSEYGTQPPHVVFGAHADGRPNGQVFIGFASVEIAEDVFLNKNKQRMGQRFVEIHRSSEQNWIAAADAAKGQSSGNQGGNSMSPPTLRLRGCPLAAQPNDVAEFLQNYGVPPQNIVMGRDMTGMPNGDAFVTLQSDSVAQRIIQEKNGADVQGVLIQITRSGYNVWCQAAEGKPTDDPSRPGQNQQQMQMNSGYNSGYDAKGCGKGPPAPAPQQKPLDIVGQFLSNAGLPTLRIRGCPLAAQPTDVAEFLSSYAVQPSEIMMGLGPDGMSNGDAYVMLHSAATADRIMQEKNGSDVQGTLIQVTRSDYNLWCQAKEGKPIQDAAPMNSGYGAAAGGCAGGVRSSPYNSYGVPGVPQAPQVSSTGDEQKDWLIDQVKKITQKGDLEKQKWWTYVDNRNIPMKDPKLFAKEFLQEFLDSYAAGTCNEPPA